MKTMSKDKSEDSFFDNRTSYSLIGRSMENDPDAWERLVRLYSPLVYSWSQESGLPSADVHDIFQEVFHALARNIKKFRRLENGSFRGWLRTMTRNKVNDHFRKSGREPQPIGGTDARYCWEQMPEPRRHSSSKSSHDEQTKLEIQHAILSQALANVRSSFVEQTWQAFWMVVIDGRETKDVAEDLSMRPGTVRVAKCRVLKRLRQELGESVD